MSNGNKSGDSNLFNAVDICESAMYENAIAEASPPQASSSFSTDAASVFKQIPFSFIFQFVKVTAQVFINSPLFYSFQAIAGIESGMYFSPFTLHCTLVQTINPDSMFSNHSKSFHLDDWRSVVLLKNPLLLMFLSLNKFLSMLIS